MVVLARRTLPLLFLLAAGCGYHLAETITRGAHADAAGPATRDKLVWPFSSDSIWNMPIGAGATYVPAAMTAPGAVVPEKTFFVVVSAGDPERDLIAPGPRPDAPCSGTLRFRSVRVPDSFVLSPADNAGNANSTSLLMPDGKTLEELAGVARCDVGGAIFGFPYATEDIYGLGLHGGQGGSGMSAVGGSLRVGELTRASSIRHALKLSVWGNRYLFYDPANATSCYRWPADRCDAAAPDAGPNGYHGTDPRLVQGTLLALPPELTAHQLAIQTVPGATLFAAFQDYGAYIVGNTASDAVTIGFDAPAIDDFRQEYGFGPDSDETGSQAWAADVRSIVTSLSMVTNNGPISVGGGGTPRREPAPPIGN